MLLHVENVLTPDQVAQARKTLQGQAWVDVRVTAGEQSALAKRAVVGAKKLLEGG